MNNSTSNGAKLTGTPMTGTELSTGSRRRAAQALPERFGAVQAQVQDRAHVDAPRRALRNPGRGELPGETGLRPAHQPQEVRVKNKRKIAAEDRRAWSASGWNMSRIATVPPGRSAARTRVRSSATVCSSVR